MRQGTFEFLKMLGRSLVALQVVAFRLMLSSIELEVCQRSLFRPLSCRWFNLFWPALTYIIIFILFISRKYNFANCSKHLFRLRIKIVCQF